MSSSRSRPTWMAWRDPTWMEWRDPRWVAPSGPMRARATPARSAPARASLSLALAIVCLLASGCGVVDYINELEDPGLDITRMEADLRSELQRDLESRSRSTSTSVASVGRVRCRQRSDLEATCFARVSRPSGQRLRKLAVSIDRNSGRYRWEYVR